MEPKVYPITIKRGADFNLELQLLDESDKPVDLSNYAWRAQLRERPEAELFYDFTISTIPSLGKVSLFMPYALTDQIMFSNGVYDLYYVGLGNQVECLMHGSVSIGWKVTDMNETPVPLPYEPLKTLDVVNGGTGANNPADARKNLGITTGLDILAHYATAEELEEAVPYPAAGDAYMVGIAAPYDIYIWDGVHKEWLNAGNAIGAKGEKGDAAFTLAVGTVTTGAAGSNASVSNAGTEENQVWNMSIPRGNKGDKGDKGNTGDKGDKGDTGATGETGPQGLKGDTGAQGPQGLKGDTGAQGAQGEKGDAAFTLAVGTITTGAAGSNASVTNVGTTADQIWNMSIPRGSKGDSSSVLDAYPVGSIYMSVNSTNPGTLFGGTWVAWGAGRVPVGFDASQSEFDTVEETGGSKTHTLTTAQMPSHNHVINSRVYSGGTSNGSEFTIGQGINPGGLSYDVATTGIKGVIPDGQQVGALNTGGGGAHNNLQPYIVCYMWKRTA